MTVDDLIRALERFKGLEIVSGPVGDYRKVQVQITEHSGFDPGRAVSLRIVFDTNDEVPF